MSDLGHHKYPSQSTPVKYSLPPLQAFRLGRVVGRLCGSENMPYSILMKPIFARINKIAILTQANTLFYKLIYLKYLLYYNVYQLEYLLTL